MRKIKLETIIEMHDDYSAFSEKEKDFFQIAKTACLSAYAPYSKFRVGAAVWMDDDSIYPGNNQENAAYPSGLCAERVALFYASSIKPNTPVKAIAVTVDYGNIDFDDVVSPCGSCRQVVAEYENKFGKPIRIFLLGKTEKVWIFDSMADLLPFIFSGDILKVFQGNKD